MKGRADQGLTRRDVRHGGGMTSWAGPDVIAHFGSRADGRPLSTAVRHPSGRHVGTGCGRRMAGGSRRKDRASFINRGVSTK